MLSHYISFGIYKNDIYALLTASLLALPLFVSFLVKIWATETTMTFWLNLYLPKKQENNI